MHQGHTKHLSNFNKASYCVIASISFFLKKTTMHSSHWLPFFIYLFLNLIIILLFQKALYFSNSSNFTGCCPFTLLNWLFVLYFGRADSVWFGWVESFATDSHLPTLAASCHTHLVWNDEITQWHRSKWDIKNCIMKVPQLLLSSFTPFLTDCLEEINPVLKIHIDWPFVNNWSGYI